jgi:ribosomal protein S18 acetylase RimI-like enzyme
MIEIKHATESDRSALRNLYIYEVEDHPERAEAFAEALIVRFKTLLAFQNSNLCGTLSWEPRGGQDDGVIELASLGVNQSFQRQGIATLLVSRMIEEATKYYESNGYRLRTIILFMEDHNEKARKFYSKVGFSQAAKIPKLYPHDDAVIWIRHLSK